MPAARALSRSPAFGECAFPGVTGLAEVGVGGQQHLRVDRPVRVVAGRAAVAHRFVLEDEWSLLRGVTLQANAVNRGEQRAATGHSGSFMRFMAVRAGDMAVHYVVRVGKREFGALVEVALVTRFRRAVGVDDGVGGPAGFDVQAAGSVAGFASGIDGFDSVDDQLGVCRCGELVHQVSVAGFASVRSNKGG